MKTSQQYSFRVLLTGVTGCLALILAGCSNGSGAPKITAAKNVFAVQHNYDATTSIESDAVIGFPATSTGSVNPTSTLTMPTAFYAYALAMGPDGTLYVGGDYGENMGSILVYAPGATGSATPKATITGNVSGTFTYADYLAVNAAGDLVVLSDDGSVEAFATGATGAATPVLYLSYGVGTFGDVAGVGTDASGEIFVASYSNSTVYVFAAGATGAAAPARSITGTAGATFGDVFTMTVDKAGEVILASYNESDDPFGEVRSGVSPREHRASRQRIGSFAKSVARPRDPEPELATGLVVFAAGASGTPTPARTITGALTTVNEPESVAVDGLDNIYYQDFEGGTLTTMMFPATATGNVAPATSMTSSAFIEAYSGTLVAF